MNGRIDIAVVAYDNADELDRCLEAFDRSVSVTVVDNSSSEDVRRAAVHNGAAYVDPGTNLGFAAGVNVALRRLEAEPPEFVLLVNPDATLTLADLGVLVGYLSAESRRNVAAVAPRLIAPDGRVQRVVWPFPTPARAWIEAAGIGRLRARRTFVIGAVVLLRWSAIEDVGMFDERFFLYAEETDWMWRAVRAGWRIDICPDATATHRGAGSSNDHVRREALFYAGQETYVRKWYGPLGWVVFRVGAGAGAGARALLLKDPRRSAARRRLSLYIRGPRRAAGIDVDRT